MPFLPLSQYNCTDAQKPAPENRQINLCGLLRSRPSEERADVELYSKLRSRRRKTDYALPRTSTNLPDLTPSARTRSPAPWHPQPRNTR